MLKTATDRGLWAVGRTHRESAAGPGGRGMRRNRRRNTLTAIAFLSPSWAGFVLFSVLPTFAGIYLSFCRWSFDGAPEWVGLANYRRMVQDDLFWNSLWVTTQFVLLGAIPTVILGFLLANLINARLRGVGALRVLYFVPIVVSTAASSVLWRELYDTQGVLNNLLSQVGITGPVWLSSTTWALPALTLMLVWLSLPVVVILYLAGLQRIPDNLYEAAMLDGAGAWQQLWSITWPSVYSTTILVSILSLLGFAAGGFELALLMTRGGPLHATESVAMYSFRMAFEYFDAGYASALSIAQLILIAIIPGIGARIRRQVSDR